MNLGKYAKKNKYLFSIQRPLLKLYDNQLVELHLECLFWKSMRNKLFGLFLCLIHTYYFLETFMWQGPVMPAWRFFLGVFGSFTGIGIGVYLLSLKAKK